MTDFAASLAAGFAIWIVVSAWHRRKRAEAIGSSRIRRSMGDPAVVRDQNHALLEGLASWLRTTRPGARLASHASVNHPTTRFSDVVAVALASVIGGMVFGFLLFPAGPLPLLFALGAPFLVDRVFVKLGGKRTAKIEQQLPDALNLQASALRAGHSMVYSLQLVAAEAKPPLSQELVRTLREIDLGHSQESALKELHARTSSQDVELWVTSMLVHRVTGGNLALIVDSLAERVRDRLRLRGEIKALTAQGRLSGVVVAMAPIAFFLLLSVTSREQMQVLYRSSTGWALLAAGLAMEGAGFLWIRWILRIRP